MQKDKLSKGRMVLSVVCFLILAAAVFAYLNHVFSLGNSDTNKQIFKAFYAEKEDTIDAVFLGTSASNRYFINPMAYNEEGMSVFTVATMGMPLFYVPELIDEVEKTQDPQLYIIELRWVLKEQDQVTDAHIRRVTDSMKLSSNKVKIIDKTMDYMDGNTGLLGDISQNKLDYYISLIKYHGKLAQGQVKASDWLPYSIKNKTKGYVLSGSTTKQVNQFESELTDDRAELSDFAYDALDEVLDYCDGLAKDKQVLFVLSPYSLTADRMAKFNTAMDIVEDRGYTVLNFNTEEKYEELGLDWDKDFYNSKHVNFMGAEKYTEALTEYLSENYDLPDHRGDDNYESWDEAYQTYKDYVKDGIKTRGFKKKRGGKVTMIETE